MEENNPILTLKEIILLKSSFDRPNNIIITDASKVKHDMNVEISNSNLEAAIFTVYLDVVYKITYEGSHLLDTSVRMSGNFSKQGDPKPEILDTFININAPAIIFPFVREVIANLSAKAMVGPVLLQPVNFIQLNKERIAREKGESKP